MDTKQKLLFAALGTSFVVAAAAQSPSEPNTALERPAWPSHQEHITRTESADSSVDTDEPARVETIGIERAYVLQVGAFRLREYAEKAAKEIGLEELRIMTVRRGDQDWYVLVLGAFESRVDAREAGEAYLDAHPDGAIWVRAAADLNESQ